ncbi:MAG: acyl-CoA dehydrogenase family protein [Pseudomonadales bacterium]
MRISLTVEQSAFKRRVEAFLERALPPQLAAKVERGASISRPELADWTRVLHEQGWAAPHWPVAHGGTGWSLVQRHIFDVACRRAHAPPLSGFGFNMVGPAIIRYGTPAQQQALLPRILSGELWWCQGYSEPQAGSDLASLGTRAVRDGDDYLVNGQKIWTSGAEDADWIFCLVRTNTEVQSQRGISFLLIDLSTPGVSVAPLWAFNGKRLWNQVFFDSVRVPIGNRLGEEDHGWTVAKSLLGDERLMVSRVAENKRLLSRMRAILCQEADGAGSLAEAAAMRAKLAALEIRLNALEAISLRLLTAADRGDHIGAEPSMLKLRGSTLVQAMDELLFEAVGHWVLPQDGAGAAPAIGPGYAEYVAAGSYHHRGYTIAGGSSEVQRNIIAKQVLGL